MFPRLLVALLVLLVACSEFRLSKEDIQSGKGSDHQDLDGDGYFTDDGADTDCDDNDARTYPGATELCDERDNDCDEEVDEGALDATAYYRDADGDAYGNQHDVLLSCEEEPPFGFVSDATDCRDDLADINPDPDTKEVCLDGLDNNCNGVIDEADAVDALEWYLDSDGDGYGGLDGSTTSCELPAGYADNTDDCNDADGAVYPGQYEVCNGYDDDCDALVDDADLDLDLESDTALTGATVLYADADGDGYGDPEIGFEVRACDAGLYPDYVESPDDCDDTDATIPYALPHRDDIVLIGFSSSTPTETVEIGGWTLLRLSYIEEISVGQYLAPSNLDECYFVVNGEASGEYSYVELDYTFFEPASVPAVNDPMHAALQWNLDAIGAEDAWQCSTGEGVKVAVIDTGVSASAYDGFGDRLEEGYACKSSSLYCTIYNDMTGYYDVYKLTADPDESIALIECGDAAWFTSECSFHSEFDPPSDACSVVMADTSAPCVSGGQEDATGHGTMVAGVIGQEANNGIGVVGLAPDAGIIPYDLGESGSFGSDYDLAVALQHIWLQDDASIANISIGTNCIGLNGSCLDEDECRTQLRYDQSTLLAALQYAASEPEGLFIALAAGNKQGCITSEAELPSLISSASAIDGVMAVGSVMRETMGETGPIASTDDLVRSPTSLYNDCASDAETCSDRADDADACTDGSDDVEAITGGIEIVAPGSYIFQGYEDGRCAGETTDLFCRADGTSVAAPHVAAAAALLMAEGASNTEAEAHIACTAIAESGWNIAEYGDGLLRPDLALEDFLSSPDATVECRIDPTAVVSMDPDTLLASFVDENEDYGWVYDELDSEIGGAFVKSYDVDEDSLLFGDVNLDHRADIIYFDKAERSVKVDLSVFRNEFTTGSSHAIDKIYMQSQVYDGTWKAIEFPDYCTDDSAIYYAVADVGGQDGLDGATDLVVVCDGYVYATYATDREEDADMQPDHFIGTDQIHTWTQIEQISLDVGGDGGCERCGDDIRFFVANQTGDSSPELIFFVGGSWYSVPITGCNEYMYCTTNLSDCLLVSHTGDDSDFDAPDGVSDGDRDVWYQSYVADLDGDGYVDLINFYNDGDWYVSLSSDGYPQDGDRWAENSGDFADVALLGDVTGDGLADVVTLYYDDGFSIACEMTGCMLAYCAEYGWVDSDGDGTVDDYVYDPSCPKEEYDECEPASSVRSDSRRGFPEDSDDDGDYDGLSTTDCDGGYGGTNGTLDCGRNNASEWFVQSAQDASGADGVADRFTLLSDSGGHWREACLGEEVDSDGGYEGFFVPYAIVDINGDGFGDLTGRTDDGNWRAILNQGGVW